MALTRRLFPPAAGRRSRGPGTLLRFSMGRDRSAHDMLEADAFPAGFRPQTVFVTSTLVRHDPDDFEEATVHVPASAVDLDPFARLEFGGAHCHPCRRVTMSCGVHSSETLFDFLIHRP